MADRLLIAVLGNRNSGKSTTWYRLFNAVDLRTGINLRPLYLNSAQSVEVFLINGSSEERGLGVSSILPESLPQIVLCSTQYREDVKKTFDYFFENGYEVIIQWLNPGYNDAVTYQDNLRLRDYLLSKGATLQVRNGQVDPAPRVKELRQFILGWATHRDLVCTEFPV
jgi:hypothetical protein